MDREPSKIIRLHPDDNVVVACRELPAGGMLQEENLICRQRIPAGHKVATAEIETAAPVKKYGHVIGFATRRISPGEHVHTHNLEVKDFSRDYAIAAEAFSGRQETAGDTFNGIVRPDGRIATRNYIGVIATVNCSASVVRSIAGAFRGGALGDFPNVDGVVPVCHGQGCGMAGKGEGFELLQASLRGYMRHPNFAGVLLVGLGCEVMHIDTLVSPEGVPRGDCLQSMTIQDSGGTRQSIEEGIERVKALLPDANRVQRRPVPVRRLLVALQCGGSDAYSGITANPALGVAVDKLVRMGGTAILGETPEIYGAEHLLTRRAANQGVGEALLERIRWWEAYTAGSGAEMNNNPSPGNKAGGLTTILEKSLGAVAKGGTTTLQAVYRYARPVDDRGLVFMDTPGYDPVSLTGMVAGGANLIAFTTGRGSVYGCRPVPVVKLATNSVMFHRMAFDMDVNCGEILDGKMDMEILGESIYRLMLETASGKKSKSETMTVGDDEFVPWHLGAVM